MNDSLFTYLVFSARIYISSVLSQQDYFFLKKNLVVNLLGLIQPKKILIFLLELAKYKITLLNRLKN